MRKLALALLLASLTGCGRAPAAAPAPPEGVANLQKARQLLQQGKFEPAADAARTAQVFLQAQDPSQVAAAKEVLAEALLGLKEYPTALRYYAELNKTDPKDYGEAYRKLSRQLGHTRLRAAEAHLSRFEKAPALTFEVKNELAEAEENLGDAEDLFSEANDRAALGQAHLLKLRIRKGRNQILPPTPPAERADNNPFARPR